MRLLIRSTNWVGDAVMSLPALRAVRARFPDAHITVMARPSVAGLFARETFADRVDSTLPAEQFDCALLLPNSFRSALEAWRARIPQRIGYSRDGRRLLLTNPIDVPVRGRIPQHESYYYLELLRRAGWIDRLPGEVIIRLEGNADARQSGLKRFHDDGIDGPVIGVSPGAAYGGAKRWPADRFAETAIQLAHARQAAIAVFGTPGEAQVCDVVTRRVEEAGCRVKNYAGATPLPEFIERAAACAVFVTNDSGAMHVASAAGTPTVAVFGATNHLTTGPTGPLARVIREPVDCSPCLLRECPIDHRCMTLIPPGRVADTALELLK